VYLFDGYNDISITHPVRDFLHVMCIVSA